MFLCTICGCARRHGESEASLRNLVLVTIDTLRADHVGAYGYQIPTTPVLDDLASRAILYENAYAHSSWTPPSHASIFTGLLPAKHGLRDLWKGRLPAGITTLAETLRASGFRTGAFVSAVPLRREVGFDQGFDVYDDHGFSMEDVFAERPADRTTDAAVHWLAAGGRQRFFLWVHYFDPHRPYKDHPEFGRHLEQVVGESGASPYQALPAFGNDIYRYDGEIFIVDRAIGRLLDELRRLGMRRNTLIVVTSDHGEYFGEHGLLAHSHVYEPVARVPLILFDPRRASRRERYSGVVRHIDLLPTLLHLLEQPMPNVGDGTMLPPWGAAAEARDVYIEHGKTQSYGLRQGAWKLVATGWAFGAEPRKVELFNLRADPRESADLLRREKTRSEAMLGELDRLRQLPALATQREQPPTKGVAERLRSLGYTE